MGKRLKEKVTKDKDLLCNAGSRYMPQSNHPRLIKTLHSFSFRSPY